MRTPRRQDGSHNPLYGKPNPMDRKDRPQYGCFASSTPILTVTGWSRIDRLSIGQEVIAFDGRTKQFVPARIKLRKDHLPVRIWELEVTDALIETTNKHPFLTSRGWVQANKLTKGDVIVTNTGKETLVLRSAATDRYEAVHNLVVEDYYNYIAAGCVVNSFCHLWQLRTSLNSAYDKWRLHVMKSVPNSKWPRFAIPHLRKAAST